MRRTVGIFALLLLAAAAPTSRPTGLGEKVADFCRDHMNQQVGNGQCAVLAWDALGACGAKRRGKDFPSQGDYTWAAATVGANSAAGIQLASDRPVMAIGGFNGSDPAPTLAQFQQYVAAGRIHYFIAGGGAGVPGGGGSGTASQITSWVRQHFTAETVGGITVYDLTAPAGTTSG